MGHHLTLAALNDLLPQHLRFNFQFLALYKFVYLVTYFKHNCPICRGI